MPALYPRRAIILTAEPPCAVVYSRIALGDDGAPGDPQYWSHADGRWTAGPLDPAVHLKPLPKPHAHDLTVNLLVPPFAVLASPESAAHIYLVAADGSIGSKVTDMDNISLQGFAGGGGPFC